MICTTVAITVCFMRQRLRFKVDYVHQEGNAGVRILRLKLFQPATPIKPIIP